MKRLFVIIGLLVAFLAMPAYVFADATITAAPVARNASISNGISYVVAVGQGVDGRLWEVDNEGSGSVKEYPKTVVSSMGQELASGIALVGSATRLTSITCGGVDSAAGDYVDIYDEASATGTPKFECAVGTAQGTNHIIIPGGATMSTGVFADSNSHGGIFVSITHDN